MSTINPMIQPIGINSPFKSKAGNSAQVFVENKGTPYEMTVKVLEQLDLSSAAGKKILLKPNAGRIARPGEGVTTNPEVVAAAIDAFQKAEAVVSVGESPIVGTNTIEAFKTTGIYEQAIKRGCTVIDMDERPCVEMNIPDGVAIDKLKVCADVFDFDYIVSIPVMKMHMHTVVTLSVKNMKGCLWRRFKTQLHMLPHVEGQTDKQLNVAIADMTSVLRPHFSIVDGTTGMEGLGPSAGKAKHAGLVIAGIDPFMTDAVACYLMGVKAEDVPHLRIAAERNYGSIDIDAVTVNPENWKNFVVPFEFPPQNLAIEFPNMVIHDQNSCSACQSTLLLLIKRFGDKLFDYFPEGSEINIAIGKGVSDVPGNTLCIGNCTAKIKNGNIFIKGCPPVASEIMKRLEDNKNEE